MTLIPIKRNDETAVPNVFIDEYMQDANGEFVKVYLYLLRCISNPEANVSSTHIADTLNLTEKDVIRALKYWNKVHVLEVTFNEETGEPDSLAFLPMTEKAKSEPVAPAAEAKPTGAKGSLSPARLKELKNREDIQSLFFFIEKYFQRPLTGPETKKVVYMLDELKFSSELIEYLVEYCTNNNHCNMQYMQKVALNWYDAGIKTPEEAISAGSSSTFKSQYLPVMKAFGISGRELTPIEKEFIDRWFGEYSFDAELIDEACKRTILSMGKPNFSYCDGILKKWRTANIHTMEDVKKLDSGFRGKVKVAVEGKTKTNNQFNNFSSQRKYDFDAMEKKLISNNQ